jgi:hypothetical protein
VEARNASDSYLAQPRIHVEGLTIRRPVCIREPFTNPILPSKRISKKQRWVNRYLRVDPKRCFFPTFLRCVGDGGAHDPMFDPIQGFQLHHKWPARCVWGCKIRHSIQYRVTRSISRCVPRFKIHCKIQYRVSRPISRCVQRFKIQYEIQCRVSRSMARCVRRFQDPMQDPIQGFKIHFKMLQRFKIHCKIQYRVSRSI